MLRAEILAAATELLDSSGDPRTVTLRAIARKVGIAAPSIYVHFLDQPAIMDNVVRQAFAELAGGIRAALGGIGGDPRRGLHTVCPAYLDFAHDHPERYGAMFGGVWNSATTSDDPAIPCGDVVRILADCVAAGHCTSADPAADAVALWLGLHGLAHQRTVSHFFPWPADIVHRVSFALSHLE